MGSEFVSGSLTDEGSESDNGLTSPISYTEQFEKHLPYYMAMGMSYNEFWNKDCCLVKYYREAQKLRRKQKNEELWLQGMYIYEALIDVAPIFHAFAKKGTKAEPYPDRPFAISPEEIREQKEEQERKYLENMRIQFEAMASGINATKFGKKEVSEDG